MKQEDRLNIQAWLDGEISSKKAAEIAEAVETDASARTLADELKAVESALKIGEKPTFVDDTREFYWEQIERQINAEELMPVAKNESNQAPAHAGSLMRWLIPVGSLAAIFAIMLNFESVNSTGPVQSLDEVITPSNTGFTEPSVILEKEHAESGVGVFSFDKGNPGSSSFSSPEDLNALPESIENPER